MGDCAMTQTMAHAGGGATTQFGKRVRRREDFSLLTGTGRYVADLVRRDMVAMRVIRSPHAHARIIGVDGRGAAAHPDCVGVLCAADLPPGLGLLPALDLLPESAPVQQEVLAREVVRYVGQPVAIVLARDAYAADDLAERVQVTYEPLPAAMQTSSTALLYPQFGSNQVHATTQLVGDPDAAFASAAMVLNEHFAFHRVAATPMEMRGAIAEIEADSGRLVLHSSTQVPQLLRIELARILGLDGAKLRVVAPRIGGGFGCKEAIYPEEVLVLLVAQRLGRPVFWLEDRHESFRATAQGREEHIEVRAAVTAEGVFTAMEAECTADIGAAYSLFGNTPGAAVATLRGPYDIPNFRSRARSFVTNKPPLNVYRGAGYPQATLAMERMMDLAAARLGLDRAEIRRRNLLQPHQFPADRGVDYPGCGRVVFDSGDYPACLKMALDAIDYDGFAARKRTTAGDLSLGIGLAFIVEMAASGPAEPARLRVRPDGKVQLLSGITAIGQGSETTLAQILCDRLGVASESVEVLGGDTDDSPDAPGTFASRGATMGGNAACLAADALILAARTAAAKLRGVELDAVAWDKGRLILPDAQQVDGPQIDGPQIDGPQIDGRQVDDRLIDDRPIDARQESLSLHDLVTRVDPAVLDVQATFADPGVAYANGCHAAVVEVDRATGVIRVLDYAVAHDCGRVANPLLVDGQIMGGVVQGLGSALFETLAYDEAGAPLVQGLWEYILPTAAVAPNFVLRHLETPSPLNPLGMKGAGEAGFTGALGAIVNGIADALAPLGVEAAGSGPFTPAHVLELLSKSSHRAQAARC
jgi:carbon-monoxide dehydrogenase large subunit